METISQSKTLPPDMATQRQGNVNLFMRAIGLDVELLGQRNNHFTWLDWMDGDELFFILLPFDENDEKDRKKPDGSGDGAQRHDYESGTYMYQRKQEKEQVNLFSTTEIKYLLNQTE